MPGPTILDDKNFNYTLLKEDVMKFVKKEGFTMEETGTATYNPKKRWL